MAYRQQKNVPSGSIEVRSHSSSDMESVFPSTQTPAAFTTTSSRPAPSITASTMRSQSATRLTSAESVSKRAPPPERWWASASARPASSMSANNTVSPSSWNRVAVARPIPPAPPVIKTTRGSPSLTRSPPPARLVPERPIPPFGPTESRTRARRGVRAAGVVAPFEAVVLARWLPRRDVP